MSPSPAARQKIAELARAANLFTSGQIEAAHQMATTLLGKYPREPLLFNILGGVQAHLENWKPAERHFQKAVKLDPDNFEILRNLGKAQMASGKILPAKRALVKALRIHPGFAEGWNTLGLIYQEMNDLDAARKSFAKALSIQPAFAEAAANILSEIEQSNDVEQLEQLHRHLDEHLRDHSVTVICSGLLSIRNHDPEAARRQLDSISFSRGAALENETLENIRTEKLAKVEDKLGHHARAFALFSTTNRRALAQAPAGSFDTNRIPDQIRERQTYFSDIDPAGWKPVDTSTDEPVFMIGFPRSGTTLLDTFLRGHPDIAVTEEKPLVNKLTNVLGTDGPGRINRLETVSSIKVQKAADTYMRALTVEAGEAPVRVDRMPLNIIHIAEIMRVFPQAKFILALRDPADVVLSCFMQNFAINDATATFITPGSTADIYAQTFSLWKLYLEKLDVDHFVLRYEDLVTDAEKSLRPLVGFLGLDWHPAMLDHHATAQKRTRINTASYSQVVQPIYKTALRRWERYADLMPGALETVKPWRAYFGYNT